MRFAGTFVSRTCLRRMVLADREKRPDSEPKCGPGMAQGRGVLRPAADQVTGQEVIEGKAADGAEQNVRCPFRMLGCMSAAEVARGDLLVHGVGFHALGEAPVFPAGRRRAGGVGGISASRGQSHLKKVIDMGFMEKLLQ
jgi:hypothetical protein